MPGYRFALSGVTLPGTDDLFGIWEVSSTAEVSFDVSACAAPAEPTWRTQLPAALDDAQAILDAQSLALQRSKAGLSQAEQRLAQVGFTEGVSFKAMAGPEAELWATLSAIQSPVSFEPRWREDVEQRALYQRWRAFLAQVRYIVSHYARIETEVDGALIGHTAVGWTGDFDTLWNPTATLESMALHHHTVHLALGSRIALLRLLTVVGTGAANLALQLTVPGAQLLVLPAVWKFVQDVLEELRQSWPQLHHPG